jgi:phospholipase C
VERPEHPQLPSQLPSPISRRTLLRAGAAASAGLAIEALPAWAKADTKKKAKPKKHKAKPKKPATAGLPNSTAETLNVPAPVATRGPNSLPRPSDPVGSETMPEIETIVVLMMENHSFDNILGMLPWQVSSRHGKVDGLPSYKGKPYAFNPDTKGTRVESFHLPDLCPSGHIAQDWNVAHLSLDNGHNDGFVTAVDAIEPMGYFDQSDLPVSYALATHFPISDRYFCSLLGQTDPNRRYLYCATSSGEVNDDNEAILSLRAANGMIFDRLNDAHIGWRYYSQVIADALLVPNFNLNPADTVNCKPFSQFATDAAAGALPSVVFLEANGSTTSEENPQDVGFGENFISECVETLMASPQWEKSAMLLTYDEWGGYYDHVVPPAALAPDSIAPNIPKGGQPGNFKQYGFRVPFYMISPWARPDYVSHQVADHTSILAFIEQKWNLPALTYRDANASDLTDMLDFSSPAFLAPPKLPSPPNITASLNKCRADGENPPTS